VVGAIGMLRMPDFYTRMHAASVIETLGAGLILLGLMLQAGFTLVAVKLLMVGVLIFFASPTATTRWPRGHGAGFEAAVVRRGAHTIETLIINVLLVLMALTVLVIARSRNLFGVIVLGGLYSFLMATVLVAMDAVDVAMTEASVGAGISTVLLLGALYLCKSEEAKPCRSPGCRWPCHWPWAPCWSTARSGCRSFPTPRRRSTSTWCRAT
jgi:monovalent cation/proton antiporter MnhG/PhaG subunit